jgi:hypothetical protein
MASGASSSAKTLARWFAAALLDAYAPKPGRGRSPITDPVITIAPPPARRIAGTVRVEVGHYHCRAGRDEPLGGRPADPGRPSRYDRDFAAQDLLSHISFPGVRKSIKSVVS